MSIRLPAQSTVLAAILALAGALPANSTAAGTLQLQFVDARRFADAGLGDREREDNLKTLSDFLQRLATRLPDGQALQIDVQNVDLAGEMRLGGVHDVRILRGRADWPRIDLRYTLRSGDTVLKQNTVSLAALGYMDRPVWALEGLGALPYEKRMLQTWFTETFLKP